MAGDYLSFNLQMLNLWIGLCRGAAGLPSDLRRLGYQDRWIEYAFQNSNNEVVVPELILSSIQARHTMLLEWKEGKNTDSEQLRRYSGITQEDLIQRAFIDRQAASSLDVVIVGKAEFAERLRVGIERNQHNFPLLLVESSGIRLDLNQFSNNSLNGVFDPVLRIDFSKVPASFVPFNGDSHLFVVADCVISQIVEYMARREPRVLLARLAEDTVPTLGIMSRQHQQHLRNNMIRQVVEQAARHEFRRYLRRNREAERVTGTPTWDILNNPVDLGVDKRSRGFRALQSAKGALLEALRTGRRPALQLELFDQ